MLKTWEMAKEDETTQSAAKQTGWCIILFNATFDIFFEEFFVEIKVKYGCFSY